MSINIFTPLLGEVFHDREPAILICPVCGSEYMHLEKVEALKEIADIQITFSCEGCPRDHRHKFNVQQHKGNTFLSWRIDDLAFATKRVKGEV